MKIKIHFITQIYLILCLISGYFHEVMTIYVCLIVHEIGHYLMIKILKKDIVLLEISPLGGILHIDKCQNDHNYKELLIYISGPLASLLLYLGLTYFHASELFIKSSFYVLILNLLPILPLDGAKIIMCLKQHMFPYRFVLKLVSVLSVLCCLGLIVYFIDNINYVIILLFFLYLNLNQYRNIAYDYYDFLCYKHFHPNKKLKNKLIVTSKNIYSMFYKGFNNLFFLKNQFISEQDALKQFLNKN